MNVKGTKRKNQVVNIIEQQKLLAKAEEIKNSLTDGLMIASLSLIMK